MHVGHLSLMALMSGVMPGQYIDDLARAVIPLVGCVEGFQACRAEGEGDDNSFSHTDHVVHDA